MLAAGAVGLITFRDSLEELHQVYRKDLRLSEQDKENNAIS